MELDLLRYDEVNGQYQLFVSSCSTANALRVLDGAAPITIIELGATYYLDQPWVSEKDVPSLTTVGAALEFFDSNPFTDLIDFSAIIDGIDEISSHDDMECNYTVDSLDRVRAIASKHISASSAQSILNALFANPSRYIYIEHDKKLRIFETFDDYLKETA